MMLQKMEVTSLEVLEALMSEFFAPGTSNARKHQIEKVLEDFGRRPDAWKNCLLCIAGTSSPYVSMFCMTSLEVSGKWGLRKKRMISHVLPMRRPSHDRWSPKSN